MEILYIAIAVTAMGSIVLSLLAMSNQAKEDQSNKVLLRLLQEQTREMDELKQQARELECQVPKAAETAYLVWPDPERGGEDG